MRKHLIFGLLLLNYCFAVGQDLSFDKNYFKNKLAEIALQKQIFTDFQPQSRYEQKESEQESVVLTKPSEFRSPYRVAQMQKFKVEIAPQQIDPDEFSFLCGPLQPRNSKDMMIRAAKRYVLNKYVFGLFMKKEYTYIPK